MMKIFTDLPIDEEKMYEAYHRNISDSILALAYRGSDYVYPGFR
jgi:hypothetical protein